MVKEIASTSLKGQDAIDVRNGVYTYIKVTWDNKFKKIKEDLWEKFIKSVFVVLSLVVLFSLFACEKRETFEPN